MVRTGQGGNRMYMVEHESHNSFQHYEVHKYAPVINTTNTFISIDKSIVSKNHIYPFYYMPCLLRPKVEGSL